MSQQEATSVRLHFDEQGKVITESLKDKEESSRNSELKWNELLKKFTARDLYVPIQRLVLVRAMDTVRSALWTLIKNKIQCVPVYNEGTGRFIGMVDVFDLVQYIFSNAGICLFRTCFFQEFKDHSYANEPVAKIVNLSNRDHWITVLDNVALDEILDMMVSKNLHRVPIMNNKLRLTGLLTQSRVVQFLADNICTYPELAAKKISELGIGNAENVYSLKGDEPSVDAFMMMLEKGVRGLAIVNDQGQLVDAITASDIKGLIYGDFFSDLRQPVLNYLPKVRILLGKSLGPISCTAESTLECVLKKLNQEKVHRIFVVDENKIPIRVLCLRDIMRVLLSPQIY